MSPLGSAYPYDDANAAVDETDGLGLSPEAVAVCIGVDALSHLHAKDLVFPHHYRAAVLCDPSGNCATPGHIVVKDDVPMMMKTYCDQLRWKNDREEEMCRWRVMLVNSPRMRYGVRIKSKSDGLEFTVLAARFQSKMEESVMALVALLFS